MCLYEDQLFVTRDSARQLLIAAVNAYREHQEDPEETQKSTPDTKSGSSVFQFITNDDEMFSLEVFITEGHWNARTRVKHEHNPDISPPDPAFLPGPVPIGE